MAERILVAYDESPQAAAALEHALERYPDAEIHVVHVTDPADWLYADEFGGVYAEEGFEMARDTADRLLESAEETAEAAGRSVTTAQEIGPTASTLVEYAEANDVDHVVVGSHGRRGLARFLLGSVAESVARRSPVSVTMVRASGD